MVLASDEETTYGLAFYYRVDSYRRAVSGYNDATCHESKLCKAFSQPELEQSGYAGNPKVLLLTRPDCRQNKS